MFSQAPFSVAPFSSVASDVYLWAYLADGADTMTALAGPLWEDIITGTASWQVVPENTSNSWADVNSSSTASWQVIVT